MAIVTSRSGIAMGKQARGKPRKAQRGGGAKKLSRTHKPSELSLEAWQIELRRQYGRDQNFVLKNLGDHPVFSEFQVSNPKSKSSYEVIIRGSEPGENHCSCPDFQTNTLGTCKHVEFTLARLATRRGGARMLAEGFQRPASEIYLHYGASREVRFRPGSNCSAELARLAGRYFDDQGVLRQESFAQFHQFLSQAAELEPELVCRDDVRGFVAQVRDAARRQELLAQAFPRGIRSAAFKKLLRVELYDYQKEGALFAARAGRALIGDEMGLGKTMQAIAAAEIMARHFGVERALIICPTSLKHQWQREIERASGRSVEVISGLRPQRQEQFKSDSFFKIVNYDVVHRDLELIAGWSPELVILDEAQRIKNWETRAARSVKKIDSPYAIVLTGTPLENRLEELVSIVQFIDQHRLGPTFRFLHDHQVREGDTGRVIGYRNLDQVGKTLQPILLRRRKADVLSQLPGRLEKNFFVPMTDLQRKYHEENAEIVARIVHKWQRYGFLSEVDQQRLMIALQNMRMACDSSFLLDHQDDSSVKPDELATLLEEIFEDPRAKVVIFSQWLRMHELLVRRLKARGWDHVLFHGGVPGPKRKELVDRFRDDPACRLFLATDAGGVGLNLQHAHVVINVDLPWNPAVLEQRIGRVHRLGQTQPVQVYNFISQATIEESMLSVLSFKKSLFAGVLDGGQKEVFLGGSRLKRFMETVEKVTGGISTPPVEESQASEESGESAALAVAEDGESGSAAGPRRAQAEEGAPERQANLRPNKSEQAADATLPPASDEPAPHISPHADPLGTLLQSGLALLDQLARASTAPPSRSGEANGEAPRRVEVSRDEQSGKAWLKVQLPEPEVLQRAVAGIQALLESIRR